MKVLVIGGGGREHAITYALSRSASVSKVFCAPGNAGTDKIATNVALQTHQTGGILDYCTTHSIDLVVIGPEEPLVEGLADEIRRRGIKVLGPSRQAAQLEGSKIFAKQFMRRHNIPSADFRSFYSAGEAIAFLNRTSFPAVIKADGLAAGKGVVIVQNAAQAQAVIEDFMEQRRFGQASERVLIENYLEGTEVSVFCVTDGKAILMLPTAQDYKRAYDDDQGPNTGGMGAVSPSPILSAEDLRLIEKKVIIPTLHGMLIEEAPYAGFLYVGLMMTRTGPRVLEYNCRLGDPEAQSILMRLRSDFGELCLAAVEGRLENHEPVWDERPAVTVVAASEGYPEQPKTGRAITGLDRPGREDLQVFHAGTARRAGKVVSSGGRVLGVTALGGDVAAARMRAYDALAQIRFDGMMHRSDIAQEQPQS